MNEDKILELLKLMVGGDGAFEWLGEKVGKSINKSYEVTHRAAHAVVGGVSVMSRGGRNAANSTVESVPVKPARGKNLEEQIGKVLDDYGLSEDEKRFCANRIKGMTEEVKDIMNRENDPEKKAYAAVKAIQTSIKQNVEYYGALNSVVNRGDDGLSEYFHNDTAKIEGFVNRAGLAKEFGQMKKMKMESTDKYHEAEKKFRNKAIMLRSIEMNNKNEKNESEKVSQGRKI